MLNKLGYPLGSLVSVKFVFKDTMRYYNSFVYDRMKDIARRGFRFLGENFIFFASKNPQDGRAHFLRCTITNEILHKVRQRFADFQALSNVSLAAMRLGLFLSGSCEGISSSVRSSVSLKLVPDLTVYGSSNNHFICLTDGAGMISVDIAELLPSLVVGGRVDHSQRKLQPAAYQARIFSSHGIFKGCLVVDRTLPPGTIIVRPSMLKARNTDSFVTEGTTILSFHQDIFLEIVNTSARPVYSFIALLNYHLIILLHAKGVPLDIFERMLR